MGDLFPENFQHVPSGFAVVNDHRKIELLRDLELTDEELNLAVFVAEFTEIIETNLSDGYNTIKTCTF